MRTQRLDGHESAGHPTVLPAVDLAMHPVMQRMLVSPAGNTGMQTGIPPLDEVTTAVMLRGRLGMFIGRAGSGKTALQQSCARHQLRAGARVVVAAYDKAGGDQWARDFAAADGIGGTPQDIATHLLTTYPELYVIDDQPLESIIERWVRGVDRVLLIVDSLPEALALEPMLGDSELARIESRLRALKAARRAGAWILVATEIANGSDLPRYAGEYDADLIVVLTYDDPSGLTRWKTTKPHPARKGWLRITYGLPVGDAVAPERTEQPQERGRAQPAKRRRASTSPARTPEQLERDVRAFVERHPAGCSGKSIEDNVSGNTDRKRQARDRVCVCRDGRFYVRP